MASAMASSIPCRLSLLLACQRQVLDYFLTAFKHSDAFKYSNPSSLPNDVRCSSKKCTRNILLLRILRHAHALKWNYSSCLESGLQNAFVRTCPGRTVQDSSTHHNVQQKQNVSNVRISMDRKHTYSTSTLH